jgi:two-component SAPR family response regulator
MFKSTFGFVINDNIQVDIHQRRIIKISMDDERKPYALNVCVIAIKDLHMTLLAYLLTNGMGNPIKRDDILKYVWDDRNLKSSSQTLWATLKELKYNLSLVGLTDDFIISNRGAHYRINAKKIEALYVGWSDNFY